MPTLVDIARQIATEAHFGQTDKAGSAYIAHPKRVAEHLTRLYPNASEEAVAAAWLHDVLEDSDLTPVDLALAGIPQHVIDTVRLLTRSGNVAPITYYRRIRTNPTARMVKHADIADNTDPDRLALLGPDTAERLSAKYLLALTHLGLPLTIGMQVTTP